MTLGNGKVARDSKAIVEGESMDIGAYWMRKLYVGQKGTQRF